LHACEAECQKFNSSQIVTEAVFSDAAHIVEEIALGAAVKRRDTFAPARSGAARTAAAADPIE